MGSLYLAKLSPLQAREKRQSKVKERNLKKLTKMHVPIAINAGTKRQKKRGFIAINGFALLVKCAPEWASSHQLS